MRFSKLEQETLLNKKPKTNLRESVKNYPGRVVKVRTAEARIRNQSMSLHDACTKPLIPQGARR